MQPIFIGGCGRNGTTLLGGMLGGHPEYLSVPEMLFSFDVCRLAAGERDARVDAPAGQHALVGRQPDPARGNDWQRQRTDRQIEIFESTTTDLLALLGYAPSFGLRARKASRRESLHAGLQELARAEIVNRYRTWRLTRRTTAPRHSG